MNSEITIYEQPSARSMSFIGPGGGLLHAELLERQIRYTLFTFDGNMPLYTSVDIQDQGVHHIVKPMVATIDAASRSRYQDPEKDKVRHLNVRDAGRSAFDQLFPRPLRERLRRLRVKSGLGVSFNSDIIPWEALHDGEQFLGQRHFVHRLPRERDGYSGEWCKPERRESERPIVAVTGGDLSQDLRALADELFGQRRDAVLLDCPHLTKFSEHCGGASVLCLFCHGRDNPIRLQISVREEEMECLRIETVRALALRRGAVVLLNACGSVASIARLSANESFGWAFVANGAGVVVGTNAEVSVQEARSFATEFVRGMWTSEPTSVATAAAAFAAAKERSWLTSVLYTFYGNPIGAAAATDAACAE
jgi:hypothetical protein